MRRLARAFTQHPQEVGETYGEHMRFATTFAARLTQAALAAGIHALIPCLCEKTASRILRELVAKMESRD